MVTHKFGRCGRHTVLSLQTAFAKWGEGQKDRPKQANSSMEAHKARLAAAAAAAAKQQQAEAVTVKPVKKGEKKQPLELHPDQFVRIKARRAEAVESDVAALDMDKLELVADEEPDTAADAADIEVGLMWHIGVGLLWHIEVGLLWHVEVGTLWDEVACECRACS